MTHHEHHASGNCPYTCALLMASTKGAAGLREDTAGPVLEARLAEQGYRVVERAIVADDVEQLRDRMRTWIDDRGIDIVLTSGGTGLSPSDVTPEATRPLIEKEVPGLAEGIRAAGRAKTPHADLSRGLAGIRGQSLIVNLPGSPQRARWKGWR